MMSKIKMIAAAISICAAIALCSCSNQEPIIGTWESSSSGNLERYDADGTYSYTNSIVNDLGILEGKWEKCDSFSSVNAEGKDWLVYLVIPESRTITGDGELGNKYQYNDKSGDYYVLISNDQMVKVIGAATVESIANDHEISELYLSMTAANRVNSSEAN